MAYMNVKIFGWCGKVVKFTTLPTKATAAIAIKLIYTNTLKYFLT